MRYKNFRTEDHIQQRSYEVFNYIIGYCYKSGRIEPKILISNPLIKNIQQTPSFNVFYSSSKGFYFYKDYATEHKGDCIKFIQEIKNLKYRSEAVKSIEANILSLRRY